MHAIRQKLSQLNACGHLELPFPGRGHTAERHAALYQLGRSDLSLARLAEAHTDALSILAEAGRTGVPRALYGVWASDGPGSHLELRRLPNGSCRLDGIKRYCSGAPLLDAALITAHDGDSLYLIDVHLGSTGLTMSAADWVSPAFRETATATVNFDGVVVAKDSIVGASHWYLRRPGFWHGAVGPAACWAGGAAGLIDAVRKLNRPGPHFKAHLGALEASEWGLRALLHQAGDEIDADPQDLGQQAQRRALMVRHLIERLCTTVLDTFGRATGPQLLAFDAPVAQRYAELTLYIRQCHGEQDLALISVPPSISGPA